MKVFISYRRSDTKHAAGRLSDYLREADNVDRVFIDVESISPGAEFEHEMLRALRESDICLALMGDGWAAGDRIHNERDPVRLEIKAALAEAEKGDLNLCPVLVDGARMPTAKDLPEELRGLVGRNAPHLSHATFRSDLETLAEQLEIQLAPETSAREVVIRTAVGGLSAAVLIFMLALVLRVGPDIALNTALGGSDNMYAFIIFVVLLGLLVPNLWPVLRRFIQRAT